MYTSTPGFTSRTAPVKTKEQKKVSNIANRPGSIQRNLRKPGPVTIIVMK